MEAQETQNLRVHTTTDQLRRLGPLSRGISLLPRQPARSILNGRHASRLRGRGLNFEELRDYLPGDDIRTIDWKVTARTGSPHVRVYTEERDRPALVIVDQRMTMFFGSVEYMKSVVAAEAAAIVAHRILAQGDRLGGLVLAPGRIAEHRPERRPRALDRLLNSITSANQMLSADLHNTAEPSLNTVLKQATHVAKTNFVVTVFSDFAGLDDTSEPLLRRLAQSNDLILFNVSDRSAQALPPGLRLSISDGTSQAELDTSDPQVHARVQTALRDRLETLRHWSRRYGIPMVELGTDRAALAQMQVLFGLRGAGR
ncbi:DUF58 domain-containing protein [Falsiruegeria mediterranea]